MTNKEKKSKLILDFIQDMSEKHNVSPADINLMSNETYTQLFVVKSGEGFSDTHFEQLEVININKDKE